MRKNYGNFKRTLYTLCAVAGFLTSVLVPNTAFADNAESSRVPLIDYISIFPAGEEIGKIKTEKRPGASALTDISSDSWYYQYVDYLVGEEIIKGTSDTTFSPDGTFTLAESAAVITRYLGLDGYAQEQKSYLESRGADGSEMWYSGYIQVLCKTGIIKNGEYGISYKNGTASFDPADCELPLKRYQFATLITRSFDIDTSEVGAHNTYREINTNGNIYITGGMYDTTYQYFEGAIADFSLIPDSAREDVLKAYYNGIFNGDAVGNFNPEAQLTRAEMAKVIAVVRDSSLRMRSETRTLPETSVLSESDFITDGWGDKTLDRNESKDILMHYAGGISVQPSGNSYTLGYTHANIAPENYYTEVVFYKLSGTSWSEQARIDLSDDSVGTQYSTTGNGGKVLFLLRSRADAKVEGVLEVGIDADGSISYSDRFRPVL